MNNNTRWLNCILKKAPIKKPYLIGALDGEGVGKDLVDACTRVLETLQTLSGIKIEVQRRLTHDTFHELSDDILDFIQAIFDQDGVVLSGAFGGRFVYDLRKQFSLFCKLVPITPFAALNDVCRIKPEYLSGVDILLVRENYSGFYQGEWETEAKSKLKVKHSYHYHEEEVFDIVKTAAALANIRKKHLTVVLKDGGAPQMSELWRAITREVTQDLEIDVSFSNIDYVTYHLAQNPQLFDVIVAPNLFGDIVADIGGVISGSRGITFSGNYSSDGASVYQTNHGSALDLVGKNVANPAGQLFSLAMLLRENFCLVEQANLIETGIKAAWQNNYRTFDIAGPDSKVVGTAEMVEHICDAMEKIHDESLSLV